MPIIRDYCYERVGRTPGAPLPIVGETGKKEIPIQPASTKKQEKNIYSSHGVVSFPVIPENIGTVQIIFIIPSPVFMNI